MPRMFASRGIRPRRPAAAIGKFDHSSSSSPSSSVLTPHSNIPCCRYQHSVAVRTSWSPHRHDINNESATSPLIPYCRSWAWQQWMLEQRLHAKRQERILATSGSRRGLDDDDSNTNNNNNTHVGNMILMLEHDHVYTLGRGADETFLTFLNSDDSNHNDTNEQLRQRLARSNRGPDSARLSVDSLFWEQQRQYLERQEYGNNNSDLDHLQHVAIIDELVARQAPPVTAPNGAPIYRVERGGQVTYHGPGQLVVYPLLDLKANEDYNTTSTTLLQPNLHWFIRVVEEVIIQVLNELGLVGAGRDPINSGVWIHEKKVAAVGVAASRWITTHGLALNVTTDLDYFDTSVMLPCGIEGRGVTSIEELLRQEHGSSAIVPTVPQVAELLLAQMEKQLGLQLKAQQSLE